MSNFELLEAYSVLRRELSLIFAGELRDSVLGPQQMSILYRLLKSPCSMSELAAHTQSDPAATSRTVAALEKAGFIRRATDPEDARKSIIHLTKKGQAQGERAEIIRQKIGAMLNAALDSDEERKTLHRLLSKITARLQEKRTK